MAKGEDLLLPVGKIRKEALANVKELIELAFLKYGGKYCTKRHLPLAGFIREKWRTLPKLTNVSPPF